MPATITGWAVIVALLLLVAAVGIIPLPLLLIIGAALLALMVWVIRAEDQARRDQQVDEHDDTERWAA